MLVIAPAEGYDAFVSAADADAYHASMGNVGWSGDEQAKEVALRRATQYIRARYSLSARATDPVDPALAQAASELALRALDGPLFTDVAADAPVVEETIGPMTTRYAEPVSDGQTVFTVVDDLLRPLLVRKSGVVMLRRV